MDAFDETIDHLRILIAKDEPLPLIDAVAKSLRDETLARIMSLEPDDDLKALRADIEDESTDIASQVALLAVAYGVAAWDPDDPVQSASVEAHRVAFPGLVAIVARDLGDAPLPVERGGSGGELILPTPRRVRPPAGTGA